MWVKNITEVVSLMDSSDRIQISATMDNAVTNIYFFNPSEESGHDREITGLKHEAPTVPGSLFKQQSEAAGWCCQAPRGGIKPLEKRECLYTEIWP